MNLGNITERDRGETCGAWSRPDWKPDIAWFRCAKCRASVPNSQWEGANLALKLCRECNK